MSQDLPDIQLELKERLNYPYILTATISNLKRALNTHKIDEKRIQILLLDFLTDIPETWLDNKFNADIKEITRERIVSNIPRFSGVPLSVSYCEANKIPLTKTVIDVDYFGLKNAIINLLDRKGMLVRKDKIERSTGKNLKALKQKEREDKGLLDDLIDELEGEE